MSKKDVRPTWVRLMWLPKQRQKISSYVSSCKILIKGKVANYKKHWGYKDKIVIKWALQTFVIAWKNNSTIKIHKVWVLLMINGFRLLFAVLLHIHLKQSNLHRVELVVSCRREVAVFFEIQRIRKRIKCGKFQHGQHRFSYKKILSLLY